MPGKRLITRPIHNSADIRAFFDEAAESYSEAHGRATRLLAYRVTLLKRLMRGTDHTLLVELGCGPGAHLFAAAAEFKQAVGLDFSPAMIERAERVRETHPLRDRIRFRVDPAETLASLGNQTVDVLCCVGAFEHMPDKAIVLQQIRRVLKPDGRFVCLTPNGGYLWYTHLANRLGLDYRHLGSDQFLTESEVYSLLDAASLQAVAVGYWSFIPRGDIPHPWAWFLGILDVIGRIFGRNSLRGGLWFSARPTPPPPA